MAIGDKQAAVRACVNQVMIDHGAPSPINATGTMDKTYKYAKANMYSFHAQVKICLAGQQPGYTYTYPDSDAYMRKTVSMTVLDIYSEISTQTVPAAKATLVAQDVASKPAKPGRPKPRRKSENKKG